MGLETAVGVGFGVDSTTGVPDVGVGVAVGEDGEAQATRNSKPITIMAIARSVFFGTLTAA